MNRNVAGGVVVAALLLAAPCAAQEYNPYGTRVFSMGGAAVCNVHDGTGAWANPAVLGVLPSWDFQFPVASVGVELDGDVIAEADQIADILYDSGTDLATLVGDLGSSSMGAQEAARETLLNLFLYEVPDLDRPGEGFSAHAAGGPMLRFGNWGVSATGLAWAGVDPVLDYSAGLALGNGGLGAVIPTTAEACPPGDTFCTGFAGDLVQLSTQLGDPLTQAQAEQLVLDADLARLRNDTTAQQYLRDIVGATAAGGTTLDQNQSGVLTRGLVVKQFALGYGRSFLADKLAFGGTLKVLFGETYTSLTTIESIQDGGSLIDNVDDDQNRVSSSDVDFDFGILGRPIPSIAVGAVARNVLSPEFEFATGERFKLERQLRAGFSFTPRRWVTLAADLDLNEIDSQTVDGLGYRMASLGAEMLAGKFVAFRLGAYENLAASGAEPVYTVGIGIRGGRFEFALAGALSSGKRRIEAMSVSGPGDTYPAGGGVSFSLAWNPKAPK